MINLFFPPRVFFHAIHNTKGAKSSTGGARHFPARKPVKASPSSPPPPPPRGPTHQKEGTAD